MKTYIDLVNDIMKMGEENFALKQEVQDMDHINSTLQLVNNNYKRKLEMREIFREYDTDQRPR